MIVRYFPVLQIQLTCRSQYLSAVHSGGARVFFARGTRLCCYPHESDQFYNQGIFQDVGHGV